MLSPCGGKETGDPSRDIVELLSSFCDCIVVLWWGETEMLGIFDGWKGCIWRISGVPSVKEWLRLERGGRGEHMVMGPLLRRVHVERVS